MNRLFFFPLLMVFNFCYSTNPSPFWSATDSIHKKYAKVLVLCITPVNDTEATVKMENYISENLCEMGYSASAANKIFVPGELGNTDSIYTSKIISNKGFDAVLTVVLIDKLKNTYQMPGKDIVSDKYYKKNTRYVWENNFYDISSGNLIYAYRSRSFSTTSKLTLTEPIGQAMLKVLVEKDILLKTENKNE